MVDYQDILSRLPLNADEDEVISDPSYILNDVRYPITYLRINDTEACAVVHATYSYSISVEGDVSGCDSKTYVVRVIVIKANAKLENIFIPNSVCTIYGAENVFSINRQNIYVEDDNPFFEYRGKNLFSKDGEDLIHGHLKDGDEPSLDGVRTIHALGWHHEQVVSCRIPASVNKIGRLVGKFGSVTFEGTIPEFSPDALDGTMIESITVFTPKDENHAASVRALMDVPSLEGYRRRDDILFASHATTLAVPKAKSYIALTRADFEHDGDTLFVNTSWIATFSPKTIRRSDVDVQGSRLLIGLHGDNDNVRGVCYDVYESPEEIDEQIAYIQEQI